jgi:hypothetical protein
VYAYHVFFFIRCVRESPSLHFGNKCVCVLTFLHLSCRVRGHGFVREALSIESINFMYLQCDIPTCFILERRVICRRIRFDFRWL